jgi:hypothetical protein
MRRALCVALLGLWSVAFLGLGGCGGGGGGGDGGGGGGGGGGGANFLALVANMLMGTSGPGGTTTVAYPTDPAGGVPVPPGSMSYQVPSAVFTAGALGTQTFLELKFNRTLLASTIVSPVPAGTDGIVLFVTANGPGGVPPCVLLPGNPVCMRLDPNGVVDPSNAIIGGVAPATLRLYYDPDDNLASPDALPAANYSLIMTNNLRGANGEPFCTANGSGGCVNQYLPAMPFTIGANTTALAMSTTTPILPVSGEAAAPINSEVILNFLDAVDFVSAVGGVTNVTSLDPFVSIPFQLGMGAQPNVGVGYAAPVDPVTMAPQSLPGTLGFILYMPDPILNPAQIRVRFVNLTGLQAINNPGLMQYQNYASNPLKYPIPSSDPAQGGATLQLPPIQPVPGSFLGSNQQVGPAIVTINVNMMVTDRANLPGGTGNALAAAFMSSFTWAVGPALARNPVPPDAIFVGSPQGGPIPFDKPGITIVNTANTTGSNLNCTNVPATYGAPVTGVLTPTPAQNRIANTSVLGIPGDMEVGSFFNQAGFGITDSPRLTIVPGVLDDQNGTAPSGILNCLNPMIPPPAPPYGNRLYVTDLTAGALKVFNSYDFTFITTIPGIASPRGLGMSPDLQYLYVSNELQGTVQRVNINPLSPNFHTILNTVTVGNGPRAISVQPNNEDVFVCNFVDNTISIIRPSNQAVRATFATGLGPSDCFICFRLLGMGWPNEYLAFIPNQFSNTVSVYESAGGGTVFDNLPEGRMIAQEGGFLGPARGTWNWRTYINFTNHPGCFIANTLGSAVDHFYLNNFTLSPPPGFPGPPGIREFFRNPVFSAYPNPSDVCIDNMSGLYNINVAGVTNNKGVIDPSIGGGLPSVVVVSYPSAGKCVAYDYNSTAMFSEVTIPGCEFLQTYYDQ